jgi:hypothetical protein
MLDTTNLPLSAEARRHEKIMEEFRQRADATAIHPPAPNGGTGAVRAARKKAEDKTLQDAGYDKTYNGVVQSELTNQAWEHLRDRLVTQYGNVLSRDHATALYGLLASMTSMVQSRLTGRWAVGLPTGTGKTEAIMAFCVALHELGLDCPWSDYLRQMAA